MSFFEDNLCQNKRSGGIISSPKYFSHIGPDIEAFDGDTGTHWYGSYDEYGNCWIGLDFGIPTEIGCVVLDQWSLHYATSVVVEGTRDSLPTQNWFPVNNMLPVPTTNPGSYNGHTTIVLA